MTDAPRDFAAGDAAPGSPTPAGAGWGWILAYGILSVVLGVAAFMQPFAATMAATLVVGAFFIAAGALSIGAGVFGRGHEGRGYQIGLGIVSLVIGCVLVFEPATGALSLTLLVAVWLGVRAAMELGFGFRMRRGRWAMVALGVVDALLAIVVLGTLPLSALTLPGFVLGVSFLLGGIAAVASALAHRQGEPAFALRG